MAERPVPDASARERNEYIPTYITKKPFYVPDEDSEGQGGASDYLQHQRLRASETDSQWYERGKRKGPAATKYRKGACENCGAMTHKTKECLSRPRAKGARWTGKNIAADEVVQDVSLGWAAKRDRWNGYEADDYMVVVQEREALEARKKDVRGDNPKSPHPALHDGPGDDARYAEESAMGRSQSTATRNLRLREDTAKYLLDLDPDSTLYDPKARTLVGSASTNDIAGAGPFVGRDEAAVAARADRFAWEAEQRGQSAAAAHPQANPTAGEALRREADVAAKAQAESHAQHLRDIYGSDTTTKEFNSPLAVTENETFVQYDAAGGGPITQARPPGRSKYPEDIFPQNHTAVWGSHWHDHTWGYACCYSFVRNSYCTGQTGQEAWLNERSDQLGTKPPSDPAGREEILSTAEPHILSPSRSKESLKDSLLAADLGSATSRANNGEERPHKRARVHE